MFGIMYFLYFEYSHMKNVQYPYKDRIEEGIQPIVISLERIASRGLVALLGRPYIFGWSVHPRDTWASNGWSGHESPQGKCRTSPGHTKSGSCWEINKNPAVFPQQKHLREMFVALVFCVKLWAEIRWWFKNLKSVYWDYTRYRWDGTCGSIHSAM